MKTVMILGGTKGVGREILKSCIKKGYNVAICGRDLEAAEQLIKELEGDKIYYHPLDLKDTASLELYYLESIKRFKKIDSLIVYAGITPIASLLDADEETYDNVFDINVKAPFFLLKHVLKGMIEEKSGSIVFFGSAHMDYGEINRAPYALTKSTLYTLYMTSAD